MHKNTASAMCNICIRYQWWCTSNVCMHVQCFFVTFVRSTTEYVNCISLSLIGSHRNPKLKK